MGIDGEEEVEDEEDEDDVIAVEDENTLKDQENTLNGAHVKQATMYVTELAAELGDDADAGAGTGVHVKTKVAPYSTGDMVQVTGGDLNGVVARIISVSERTGTSMIAPLNTMGIGREIAIETHLLTRYVTPGKYWYIFGIHILYERIVYTCITTDHLLEPHSSLLNRASYFVLFYSK